LIKILNKSEAFKTLEDWGKSEGEQAYYLFTLKEKLDVELDRDSLIIVRCPESTPKDA
jgi:hypothetical protein